MSLNVCSVKEAEWKGSVDFLIPSDDDSEFHTVVVYTLTYEQCAEWVIRKIRSLLSADKIFLSSSIECVDDSDFNDDVSLDPSQERSVPHGRDA